MLSLVKLEKSFITSGPDHCHNLSIDGDGGIIPMKQVGLFPSKLLSKIEKTVFFCFLFQPNPPPFHTHTHTHTQSVGHGIKSKNLLYPPQNPPQTLFVVGYTVFTLSVRVCVRVCVRPSVTFCFFNILKSHCWIFIKPCKHVHICKTNTLDKKVRARGQFY